MKTQFVHFMMHGKHGRQIEDYKEVGERLLQWAITRTEPITWGRLSSGNRTDRQEASPKPQWRSSETDTGRVPKERDRKRHSSGEGLDARDSSRDGGAKDKSRDRSHERVTRERSRDRSARERGVRNKSRERSRERVTRDRSRERGTRDKSREISRERVTARRPKSPPRTYATEATCAVYSRSSAIAKELRQALHCIFTQMPLTIQRLNGWTQRLGKQSWLQDMERLGSKCVCGGTARVNG